MLRIGHNETSTRLLFKETGYKELEFATETEIGVFFSPE